MLSRVRLFTTLKMVACYLKLKPLRWGAISIRMQVCVRKQVIAYERARRAACPKGYESPAGARKRVVARSTFVLK